MVDSHTLVTTAMTAAAVAAGSTEVAAAAVVQAETLPVAVVGRRG